MLIFTVTIVLLKVQANGVRQRKKRHPGWKRIFLTFASDFIAYVENPKESME